MGAKAQRKKLASRILHAHDNVEVPRAPLLRLPHSNDDWRTATELARDSLLNELQ
jgi:hypothetical protein